MNPSNPSKESELDLESPASILLQQAYQLGEHDIRDGCLVPLLQGMTELLAQEYSRGYETGYEKAIVDYTKTVREAKKKGQKMESKPMGVSQWREHGKKYGYWDYFKEEAYQAGLDAAIAALPKHRGANPPNGYNRAIEEAKSNIEKLKEPSK